MVEVQSEWSKKDTYVQVVAILQLINESDVQSDIRRSGTMRELTMLNVYQRIIHTISYFTSQ